MCLLQARQCATNTLTAVARWFLSGPATLDVEVELSVRFSEMTLLDLHKGTCSGYFISPFLQMRGLRCSLLPRALELQCLSQNLKPGCLGDFLLVL